MSNYEVHPGLSAAHPELPPIADDLETARKDLAAFGCARLGGALSNTEVREIREAVAQAAEEEVREGTDYLYSNGSNQRVWSLFNRGETFLRLAEHSSALALMETALGPKPLVSNLSANITGSGGTAMVPHWDQDWAERPWPHALAAHVIWMLDDFTVENGATLVAPGSHLLDGPPPEGTLVPATGPAGTALAVDGRIWHGTGANVSQDARRMGILAYYCRPWIRQQENMALSMTPEVQAGLSQQRRALFGLDFHEYLNMVGGPPRDLPRY
ncbi:phytanoyl-CoA dioxygenase family protein [Streptomyces sp. NPDC051677]|uniref:phytanoyl-CoA dioxygenase family protein n=1 Tax=Streptomyces sp. NPDC051677 TaxID=3365669 RepID=UPI0037D4CB9E